GGTITLGPGLKVEGGGGTVGDRNNPLINNATIVASGSGNVLFASNFDNRGRVRAESGATLNLTVGPQPWTNRGAIEVDGAALNVNPGFSNPGRIDARNS